MRTSTSEQATRTRKTESREPLAGTAAVRTAVSDALKKRVREIAGEVGEAVIEAIGKTLPSTAEEFATLERRLGEVGAKTLGGPVFETVLREIHRNEELVAESVSQAAAARPLEVHSHRDVLVGFVCGGVAVVHTPYAVPSRPPRKRAGRRRAVGKRGASGTGCYPVLARLGFLGRTSPLLTSTVARAAAELGSYVEARDSLAARGTDLDLKAVRLIAHRVADTALEARLAPAEETRELEGKRVVVAFDGGRVRTRVSKRGRRRVKTRRRRYDTPWREPALVAIYVVDENGKKTKDRPWYEGTLNGWDAAFEVAVSLLRRLGARHARELVIAGDGAATIWDRVDELVDKLGLDRTRLRLFVDFWHAVQHIHGASELVKSWTPEERAQWVRLRRRELFKGHADRVVTEMRSLAVGRNAQEILGEADYFANRLELMRYDELRAAKLPIGTGGVESAVRRVVNLRMKGPGIFWDEPNAERMLTLRCRLKSGRWDDLERVVYAGASAPHGRVLEHSKPSRPAPRKRRRRPTQSTK